VARSAAGDTSPVNGGGRGAYSSDFATFFFAGAFLAGASSPASFLAAAFFFGLASASSP
jgi:hypothetical protein